MEYYKNKIVENVIAGKYVPYKSVHIPAVVYE